MDVVRFRDFSLSPEPVTFDIAPDTFECLPEIPLDALADMANLASTSTDDRSASLRRIYDLFDGILLPDSAAKFRARGKRSTEEEPNLHPIGMRHIKELLPWLMEVYGLRPTQPSDESSDGSPDEDGSSTDTA